MVRLEQTDLVNVLFRFEFTANFMNTYYYNRLETWVQNVIPANKLGDPTEINIHPCTGIWDIHKMPYRIRSMVLEKYDPNHEIHKLVQNLNDQEPLDEWFNFVNTWDTVRGNSWKDVFPDFVNQYKVPKPTRKNGARATIIRPLSLLN